MTTATLMTAKTEVHLTYGCPCGAIYFFDNYQVAQGTQFKCDCCDEILQVEPVDIKVQYGKPKSQVKKKPLQNMGVSGKAKNILVSQGYTSGEADNMLGQVTESTTDVSTLVRKALATVEV